MFLLYIINSILNVLLYDSKLYFSQFNKYDISLYYIIVNFIKVIKNIIFLYILLYYMIVNYIIVNYKHIFH